MVVVFMKALEKREEVWRSGNRCGRERCGSVEKREAREG